MNSWSLVLPVPPSTNRFARGGISRQTGKRIFYTPANVAAWEEAARLQLMAAGVKRLDGYWAWSVSLTLHTIARDLDNCAKVLCDTIADVIHIDDYWMMGLSASKRWVHHRRDEYVDLTLQAWQLHGNCSREAQDSMNALADCLSVFGRNAEPPSPTSSAASADI